MKLHNKLTYLVFSVMTLSCLAFADTAPETNQDIYPGTATDSAMPTRTSKSIDTITHTRTDKTQDTGTDNSEVTEQDKSANELAADQQNPNTHDTQLTADIRKRLMKQKDLSTFARNIQIISIDGKVTLKGPVRTKAEEKRVLKYARAVAGKLNVVNEIEITPDENTK